jgi:hypothetical protein
VQQAALSAVRNLRGLYAFTVREQQRTAGTPTAFYDRPDVAMTGELELWFPAGQQRPDDPGDHCPLGPLSRRFSGSDIRCTV